MRRLHIPSARCRRTGPSEGRKLWGLGGQPREEHAKLVLSRHQQDLASRFFPRRRAVASDFVEYVTNGPAGADGDVAVLDKVGDRSTISQLGRRQQRWRRQELRLGTFLGQHARAPRDPM